MGAAVTTVTKFAAYGLENPDPVRRRNVQRVVMTVTGAAADVTWDIGNLTPGTFWTAAVADATYGTLSANALAVITAIAANALAFDRLGGTIATNYQAAPAANAATLYTITTTSEIPVITFDAANAPTSAVVIMEWELKDGVTAFRADLGA
jgi:hypothetical protein